MAMLKILMMKDIFRKSKIDKNHDVSVWHTPLQCCDKKERDDKCNIFTILEKKLCDSKAVHLRLNF